MWEEFASFPHLNLSLSPLAVTLPEIVEIFKNANSILAFWKRIM